MPDRFAMNTTHVEELLDQLGIPLPSRVAHSRALLGQVGELDVVIRPPLSTNQLAQQALAMIEAGQAVDLVALVSENAANGLTGDADKLLRAMQDHATLVHDQAIRSAAARELLLTVRAATLKLFGEARQHGDAPSSAQDAVDGGPQAVKSFQSLKALADRYIKLRALHAELLAGSVDATSFAWFRDTKCKPTFGMVKPEPAGPTDLLARVRWLSTPEAQAWVPSGPECTEHYFAVLQERQKPKKAELVTP